MDKGQRPHVKGVWATADTPFCSPAQDQIPCLPQHSKQDGTLSKTEQQATLTMSV